MKLTPWIDKRFPLTSTYEAHLSKYYAPKNFNFWYLDTWICDLSFKSKKFLVSNKIEVNQLSADTHQNEVDNTFLKNKKDGIPEKDFLIWKDTEENRKKDASKLI